MVNDIFLAHPTPEVKALVGQLVEERLEYRERKLWAKADEIRMGLAKVGVVLEDTSNGTRVVWKHNSKRLAISAELNKLKGG